MQGFLTSLGNRERRVHLSLQVTLGPLVHAILTSALAVFMLSTSPFEFVIRHFFWLLLVVLCVGAFNSLVIFPIILSMIGPEAELVPLEHPDRISTPSPVMSRSSKRANKTVIVHGGRSRSCNKPHYHHKDVNVKDPSLTTITEESPSWKSSNSSIQMNNECYNGAHYNNNGNSNLNNINNMNNYRYNQPNYATNYMHNQPPPQYQQHANQSSNKNQTQSNNFPPELQSIVVQPEVTVETHANSDNSNTTKVTATANIKVELVTPGRPVRSYSFTS